MSDLYKKILTLCEEKGVKVGGMCREASISKSTLAELKAGRTKSLNISTLTKIADYFGVSLGYFDEADEVDAIRNELFEKRKLLFDMSKAATAEQLDTFIKMFKAVVGNNENNE